MKMIPKLIKKYIQKGVTPSANFLIIYSLI